MSRTFVDFGAYRWVLGVGWGSGDLGRAAASSIRGGVKLGRRYGPFGVGGAALSPFARKVGTNLRFWLDFRRAGAGRARFQMGAAPGRGQSRMIRDAAIYKNGTLPIRRKARLLRDLDRLSMGVDRWAGRDWPPLALEIAQRASSSHVILPAVRPNDVASASSHSTRPTSARRTTGAAAIRRAFAPNQSC